MPYDCSELSDKIKNAFDELGEFSYKKLQGLILPSEGGTLHYSLNFEIAHKKLTGRIKRWWNAAKGREYMKELDHKLYAKLSKYAEAEGSLKPDEREIGFCNLIYRYSSVNAEIHIVDSTLDRRKEKYDRRQRPRELTEDRRK